VKIYGVDLETTKHTLAQCQDRRREGVFSAATASVQQSKKWQEARILCGRQRLPSSRFVFFTTGIVTGSDVGRAALIGALHV
jgi:hypothetical protein